MSLTVHQIRKLRPTFKVGNKGMTMVEWFIVEYGKSWASIRSGLRHADGETKSPYHYEHSEVGSRALRNARMKFTVWYEKLPKTE